MSLPQLPDLVVVKRCRFNRHQRLETAVESGIGPGTGLDTGTGVGLMIRLGVKPDIGTVFEVTGSRSCF